MTEDVEPEDEVRDDAAPAYGTTRVRAPRISQGDVLQAADALLLEGHRPTIDRVRMRLGRGSPNTIQEYLEVWWTKLGSRINDIPGREIPGIPDPVARALQGLWNTALENAHASLDERAAVREEGIVAREADVAGREELLAEQERIVAARVASLEEALELARAQLVAANNRADRLEESARSREVDAERLRQRAEAFEREAREVRDRSDAAVTAHQAERGRLDERHAANEARWMVEVDRSRQALKEGAQDRERQGKELRGQISQIQAQREELKRELQVARAKTKSTQKINIQLEKRVRALMAAAAKIATTPRPKSSKPRTGNLPSPLRSRKTSAGR